MSEALSLRAQLVGTLLGSVVATAAVLIVVAYHATTANLELQARQSAHTAAHSRAGTISHLVDLQQQRADRFLVTAAALCGEQSRPDAIAWERSCVRRALADFRESERAAGAVLSSGVRRIAVAGVAPDMTVVVPHPLARVVSTPRGMAYVLEAMHQNAALRLLFLLSDFDGLFVQPIGVGTHGEVFLRQADGVALTPIRYATGLGMPGATISESGACPADAAERLDIDYRGVPTIHSAQPVTTFPGGVCVEAHVSHDETLAPARTLLADLILRAGMFVGFGLVLALFGAAWMAAPVRRLEAVARRFEAGALDDPIVLTGPSEVRGLARSLAAMAHALGQQMTREREARREAEQANRAKDEFLAVLSHELRTPLAATLGWTRLLRHGPLEPARLERAITVIERSAQTQKRLIEDLVDVSRIIAGRLELERAVLWFEHPIRSALDDVRAAAEDKGVVIETALESSLPIAGDSMRLEQIVSNLLTNAIKFTPTGGRVLVTLRAIQGWAELSVTDTGLGIAPEFLPYLFERFTQADSGSTRQHRGLGLGLSIVRHLVTLHGGAVHVTSPGLGGGATFTVRLPLADGATPTAGLSDMPANLAKSEKLPLAEAIEEVNSI
jgi:signal transduction histidine kinase